jgi:glycosyltransferase involved in cell wall biosynthesis
VSAHIEDTPGGDPGDPIAKIGDLAAAAGIRRVHLLSWRDLDDVEAGGSEVHAAHVARLWAAAGLDVMLRTSHAQGHPTRVNRDGYRVVRKAGRYLVFPRAALSEMAHRAGPRDAMVEIWNGMPFFTPLWDHRPKVVLLHHIHAEMWQMVLGKDNPGLARFGDTVESKIAPWLYRRSRIVTLSESSKADMVSLRGFRAERISVVPPGIDPHFSPGGRRDEQPLVVAVGRLVPVKRYDLLIRSVAEARKRCAGLQLVIVGDGYEREMLDAVVAELDAEAWVSFAGHISEDEVVALYRRAWVVASASAREGWGMTLTEAAACGTPVVATRIAGHTDSVADGLSGLLTDGTADALGNAIADVVSDPVLRARLSAGALTHAGRLTWEATATGIMRALAEEAGRKRFRH